jgi:hypothetical protein
MIEFIKNNWFECVFTGVLSALGLIVKCIWTRVKKEVKEQKYIKTGVLAIIHDRLYQSCRYYIEKGSVSVDELSNVGYLYTSYHELGGNGTGTQLYNRVSQLPIIEHGYESK